MFGAAEAVLRDREPVEGVFTFLAARTKRPARELSEPVEKVFRGASAAIEQMSLSLIEKRTAQEYDAAFGELLPKYVALTLSLSRIARAVVSEDALDLMTRESICELEADFRDKAADAFGSVVKEQVLFTISAVRKINDILASIRSTKIVDESKQKEDRELSEQFTVCSLVAHFSLDCLRASLQHHRPIYPDVMPRVMDGLRAMVNAYAWARRGLALRTPEKNEPTEGSDQDEGDDRSLVDLSIRTLADFGDDSPSHAS
jgi:hypothetical protein